MSEALLKIPGRDYTYTGAIPTDIGYSQRTSGIATAVRIRRPNKKVKLAGKTLQAILARQLGSYSQLIAPVVACSLPPMR